MMDSNSAAVDQQNIKTDTITRTQGSLTISTGNESFDIPFTLLAEEPQLTAAGVMVQVKNALHSKVDPKTTAKVSDKLADYLKDGKGFNIQKLFKSLLPIIMNPKAMHAHVYGPGTSFKVTGHPVIAPLVEKELNSPMMHLGTLGLALKNDPMVMSNFMSQAMSFGSSDEDESPDYGSKKQKKEDNSDFGHLV